MAYRLIVYPEAHLVIYIYEGDVSFEELKQARKEFFEIPEYTKLRHGVCDFRDAQKMVSMAELTELSEDIKNTPEGVRWCLLNSTPKETGLSGLLIHQLDHTTRMGTFSTVRGASAFLGINLEKYLK